MTDGPLISPDDLAAVLGDVTVLDVRYALGGPPGRDEHLAGHVPGAAYVDLDADLADPPGAGGRHPLPDESRFEAAMRRAGVSGDRPVVVYDDWQGRAAARAWWLLRHHGHGDVRVLDGGWTAWLEDGHPAETGEVPVEPGDFTVSADQADRGGRCRRRARRRGPHRRPGTRAVRAGRRSPSTRSPGTSPAR